MLHVTTDPADAKVVLGRDHRGDPDLLMHYAVCRAAGVTVRGPAPRFLIGEVARSAVLGYLLDELSWAIDHTGEAYAVLNAARALHYLHHDQLVSKVHGGEAALAAGTAPALLERALRVQRGALADRPPTPAARTLVSTACEHLLRWETL